MTRPLARRARPAFALLALLVPTVATVLVGCRSGSNVAPPSPTSAAAEAKPAAKPAMALPTVRVVLDDPRLAAARGFERAKDYASAARAVHEARPADLAPEAACAWDYVEGRLWSNAATSPRGASHAPPSEASPLGDADGGVTPLAGPSDLLASAAAAFARADVATCALAPYARLRGAQALARAGHADEAIARAQAVPEDLAARDEAKLVLAESFAAKGDRRSALPLWRAWLAANAHGPRWVDTSVRIATALLDGVDGPAEGHARDAYDAATRVVTEAPKYAESSGANAARQRAVALLRAIEPGMSDALGDDERSRQAQGWLDGGEAQKAFDLTSSILGLRRTGPVACKAALTRANAAAKLKSVKIDAWSDAVAACDKESELVTVLYSGAKARAGKDPKLAIDWFARLEQLFPAHRLADDARFRAALLVAQSTDEGHEDRAEQMLSTLPDTYPAGDMKTEALFRVGLAKMQHGDWEGSKASLDRIVALAPDDRHWATAGRAEYFRARAAAATGDRKGAHDRFQHVVETHPLTYYMLLSYGRLVAEDAEGAKRILDAAIARERGTAFPSRAHPELESPAFLRAKALLEVGETEAARKEFTTSGATAEGVDTEVVWTVGALYNQAGVPELGHAFARGRLNDHLEHYPEGKWRLPWETAYPRPFEPLVLKACEKYNLPRELAWAIMREESSFVADAKSPAAAFGLMQLIVPTAKWMAAGTPFGSDEASLRRPEVSIEFGTKLLSHLRGAHGHLALAIGAYNGGGGAVNRWMNARSTDELDLFVELVPWDETRNYIKRVLSSDATYAFLYDPAGLKETFGLPLRVGTGH